MTNKHEAMIAYIQQCPQVKDLFFNFSTSENGDTVVSPVASDYVVQEFTDKSAIKWYDFSIIRFLPLTTDPNDPLNTTIIFDVEQVMAWIEDQEDAENYPDFGDKCEVQEISVLQDIPTVAGRDQKGAKYMFSCRIEYLERK